MKRFWQSMSTVAAVCLMLAACVTTGRPQSALLLGLNRVSAGDEEIPYPTNRTLWIAPQNGKMQILELPDLIVPRKTGFWRVGVRSYCHPKGTKYGADYDIWSDVALFALPVSERPIVYGLVQCREPVQTSDAAQQSCEDVENDVEDGIDVQFVNRDYLSLRKWARNGPCAPHPDGSDLWSVQRLGDPFRVPIAYGDIEGNLASNDYEWKAADALLENASGIFDDGQKMPLGEGNTEEDMEIRENFPKWSKMPDVYKVTVMQTLNDGCFPKHDDRDWYIARNRGQWVAHGRFDTHRLCGTEVDFELPLHASFAAPATAPISLDAIGKQVPGAYDAFWSPGREMVVVLIDPDHTSLEVFLPRGQVLGKPVISMQLKEFEGAAMAEWATGSNVTRWTAELGKIKAQGVVTPLLSSSPDP
jgi:hypothetical protein